MEGGRLGEARGMEGGRGEARVWREEARRGQGDGGRVRRGQGVEGGG